MIEITIEVPQLKKLQEAVRRSGRNIAREFAAALNATGKKTKSNISKQIRTELAVSAKGVNDTITQGGKASASRLRTNVLLSKTARVSLKRFAARQTKRGVSYKISKAGGTKRVKSAFISQTMGGHVYKRTTPSRFPVQKLMGPSPWGVFIKQKMTPEQEKMIREELAKQVDRRIRLNILRAEGLLKQ